MLKRAFASSSKDSDGVAKKARSSTHQPSSSGSGESSSTERSAEKAKLPEKGEMVPLHQVSLSEKTLRYSYYMSFVHRGIDPSYNSGSAITLHSELLVVNHRKCHVNVFVLMYEYLLGVLAYVCISMSVK